MADAVATVVVEVVKNLFKVIGRYISYTSKYRRNIQSLEDELQKIQDTADTVLMEVRTTKNNAQDIRQDVLGWLQKCEELKSQGDRFLKSTRHFNVSCLCCRCINLRSRYLASSEAAKITSMVTLHRVEGKFDKVGQEPQLVQLPLLYPGEFCGFGSRTAIMKEVMDGLKHDSVFVIGLCGMGGVGKTMLVKKIADEVTNEKLFDEVVFVVVSQDLNVKAIQDQLASRLDLKAIENEMDILGRAQLLHKRLMDEEKKILVILDDIWEELNLRSIGIPVHGDRTGFKILLTSRFDNVCIDMESHKRLEVGILSKEEAWNLFQMSAKIYDESILHIAQEVSQECAGLPLAIVTVGKSLRNKKEHAFRDVLRKLRNPSRSSTSRIHDVLYSCIKSSYDYLESDEHRSLLLLCSVFPEDYDIEVEDLVRYARGLFNTFETMAEARDRVEAIVDELMKCYLLLPGERMKCVKLHDVVRDLCLSIASKSGDVHIYLKFDEFRKMPDLKSLRLQLLRLGETRLGETENKELNFSKEMEELRVLEINHIRTRLPSSLQFLSNLHTLSLNYCRLSGDFAVFGSLKMLRVLSFFHSIVENFPLEISELTNLQCLDLRFQLKYYTIPLGTLSSLKELEELYLGAYISGDIESLKEVRSLSKLHTIQFVFEDYICLDVLLANLNLSQLSRFNIALVEAGGYRSTKYQIKENVLEVGGENVSIDLSLLKALMWRVKRIYFHGRGLTNVVDDSEEDEEFQNLKQSSLHNRDMKYLVDANYYLETSAFSKLETLDIKYTSQLEELIHGDYPLGNLNVSGPIPCPLSNLRKLQISGCDKIVSLFPHSVVKYIRKLEIVEIASCPVFERIVRIQKDKVDFSDVSGFHNLKHLTLFEVPGFRSLRPEQGVMTGFNKVMLPELEHLNITFCDSIKEIAGVVDQQEVCFSLGCSLPKVRYLHVRKCNNLSTIAKSGLVHGFQDIETLSVWECLSLEFVFDFEEIMGDISAETEESTLLNRLEWVYLYSLPNLKHIWRMLPPKGMPVFQNLMNIQVRGCRSLRYLLTPTIANMLVHLEEIVLEDNELMEAIIGRGEVGMPNDGGVILQRLLLPKFKSLKIESLPSLRKLCMCSPEITLELPSLSNLDITFMVQDIFTRDQISRLTSLTIGRISHRRYLLTPSSAEALVHLEKLVLLENESMEAIFGAESLDGEEIPNKTIVLSNLRKLKMSDLPNIRMLCSSLNLNVELPSLNSLWVEECPKMRKLCAGPLTARHLKNVNYGGMETEDSLGTFLNSRLKVMLPKLEDLHIKFCDRIKERAEEAAQQEVCFYLGSFLPKVRNLAIEECNNMLTIAKSGLVHGFQELEKLIVSTCLSLEFVFEFEETMGEISAETEETTLLDRLELLYLYSLPKLKHIWRMLPPKEMPVFRNLKEIKVRQCSSLRYLLTPNLTNMLVHLEEIVLEDNELMEAVIGRREIDVPNPGEEFVLEILILPKLKYIKIERLPSFSMFCCCSPQLTLLLPSLTKLEIINSHVDILTKETHALRNLTKIEIEKCGSFKYLLTSSAEVLVHLEELVLRENDSMEAIFGSEGLDGEEIPNQTILLPKLRKLDIFDLPKFRMLCCSLNLDVDLPSLTQLYIQKCPKMIKLCAGQLSAPHLKYVKYGRKNTMVALRTFRNIWLKDCESMTRCLNCTSEHEICSHLDYQNSESEMEPNRANSSKMITASRSNGEGYSNDNASKLGIGKDILENEPSSLVQ